MGRLPAVVLAILALALGLAACGDDEEETAASGTETTTAATDGGEAAEATEEAEGTEEVEDDDAAAGGSDEEQIEELGNAWADLYAAGDEAMCAHLHEDIEPGCSQFVQGALTGSTRIQRSYKGATVEQVEVKGDAATAEFSNGESVELARNPDGSWGITSADRR